MKTSDYISLKKTKMRPQTLKMLIMFFVAAALLNLTKYAFYNNMFYDPLKHTAINLDIIKNVKVHAPRTLPRTRRFLGRNRVIRHINWSALLLSTKSKGKEAKAPLRLCTTSKGEETSPIIDFLADYMEQTTDTNSFYYYNEILMRPVMCPLQPPGLGPIPANKTEVELESVEKLYPEVQQGGMYTPPICTARHKVAIIIPFRDRLLHLAIFLRHMHPFLMSQQIEYGIFVVEQYGNTKFNRAKLMNVGFVESQKLKVGGWQCFIFHDIDLLPLDLRNMYSCPRQPRHMSASIDTLNFKVRNVGYHIARYKMSIARYAMLGHKKSEPNPKRYQLLSQTSKGYQKDGLSTLEYQIMKVTRNRLYTHILANIVERPVPSWSY